MEYVAPFIVGAELIALCILAILLWHFGRTRRKNANFWVIVIGIITMAVVILTPIPTMIAGLVINLILLLYLIAYGSKAIA